MKILKLLLIICLYCSNTFGQKITIKTIESRLITNEGVEFIGDLKNKKKDHYSFKTWDNKGVLFLNSTKYLLSNINFNASTNSFDSRVDRKKMFSFKSEKLDSVIINNRLFKKIDSYFYEVLLEKGNNLFLRKHDIKISKGSINRLDLSEGQSSSSLAFRYLIKINNNFKKINLNKKSIFELLVNSNDINELEEFVQDKKLSYKKVNDIIKMLSFLIDKQSIII